MKKLFFALITSFIFVATAWGQCTETIANFTLGDMGGGFNYSDKSMVYKTGLSAPIVSFDYDAVDGATDPVWRVDEYTANGWVNHVVSTQSSGSTAIQLSKETREIRFVYSGNFKGTFSNVVIKQGSYLEIPTNEVDFGRVINKDNVPSQTINIAYSSISENLTAELTKKDGIFSINNIPTGGTSTEKVTLAYAGCSYGSVTLYINFKPQNLGYYSDVIKFSDGTQVTIKGTYTMEILSLKNTSYTSATLSWERVPGATEYQIRNLTTGATYNAEYDDTYLTVTGLKMGSTYEFVLYPIYNGTISPISSNSVYVTTLKEERTTTKCIAYSSGNERSFSASTAGYIEYTNIDQNNNLYPQYSYTTFVSFYAKRASSLGNPDMKMLVKVKGGNYQETGWTGKKYGLSNEYDYYEFPIPANTVSIKFETGIANGLGKRYVKELTVYKENILESDKNILDFGEVELGKSKSLSFKLTYANAADLFTHIDSEFFTISNNLDVMSCKEGEHNVTVTFTPTDCRTDYTAVLTLYNGKEISITLKGKVLKAETEVNKIIWNGSASTEWDNRDNWNKEDGTPLLCTDVLSTNLTVTIPGGLAQYPVIPDVSTEDKFFTERNNQWNGNQVNAGDNVTATKVADKIIMESGAALVGVETLNSGNTPRYTEVQMDFTPERYSQSTGYYEWSLVGPVAKPWDEENPNQTRDVVSGDYYKNDLPHVYMHEAVMTKDGEDYIQTWDNSFASLTVKVPHDKAFAIRMPNQYGRNSSGYGIPASIYNKRNNTSYEAKENITFTFTGRFYNEAGLPEYTGLTPEVPVLLNNTYPANIDADMLQSKGYGTIQCYEGHSFVDVTGRTDAVISSGYGFIFTPNVAEFTIPSDCFQTTKVINNRNAEAEVPSLRLQLKNEDVDGVYSTISISHDELKDDAADYAVDAPKLFNDMESNLADLYVMRYDFKWAGLSVPTMEESLPLGIKVRTANQKHRFNLLNSNLDYDIILEDRQEGKEYNLSAGEVCEVSNLAAGDCRGRFYLKTSESSEDDDEVTTDILDNEKLASIDIYAQGNSVVVSSTNNVNIQKIVVSDLSGRQMNYNVSGQYIVLDLPVSSGIYTINVMGDTANRIEKIKLN